MSGLTFIPFIMVQYLIAVWDYTAEGEFELSFKQGERIKLLEKHNDDWWEGTWALLFLFVLIGCQCLLLTLF
ncbi:hypothetical protein BDF14DRAFT_1847853 [Spinellus fusiger]|nr:hypothetical protein BDF14DRAFT_1847853 [Spinellus fusiger]